MTYVLCGVEQTARTAGQRYICETIVEEVQLGDTRKTLAISTCVNAVKQGLAIMVAVFVPLRTL